MGAVIRFLLSMKTAFGIFLLFVIIVFVGSLMLPNNLAFFSGIDDTPLFLWLSENFRLSLTWWIYALVAILGLFAVSTVACTVEALLKRMSRASFIVKISPQVMHVGVLFIMLGHLLTAYAGFRQDFLFEQGKKAAVTGDISVSLEDVSVVTDENGYDTDWQARLTWFEGEESRTGQVVRPVRPLYVGRFGLYIKSVSVEPEKTALVRVCRDPGAVWALFGGVLLSVGGMGFLYGRFFR